jgi:hypothetical protein
MTTAAEPNLYAIPESRAARWAWRVSLIAETFYLVVASATQYSVPLGTAQQWQGLQSLLAAHKKKRVP